MLLRVRNISKIPDLIYICDENRGLARTLGTRATAARLVLRVEGLELGV